MIDRDAELEAFCAEIEGTGWRVQTLDFPHSTAVCLRLEQHVEGVEEPVDVFEICRRSVAGAVESARKRVFSSCQKSMSRTTEDRLDDGPSVVRCAGGNGACPR